MEIIDLYYEKVMKKMKEAAEGQRETLKEGALRIQDCVNQQHKVYFFGTGHSYIVGQEAFARAGTCAGFVPVLENELGMNHAYKSTLIERTEEYAGVIMGLYDFQKGDMIIITSNSGRNALTIELALRLKQKGLTVIALTSLKHSMACESRHKSGKRLFELADLVLDNCSEYGDACIRHNENTSTGPTSTVLNCFILHCMLSQFVQLQIEQEIFCPVFKSSNMDYGDEANQGLFKLH